MLRLPVSRLYLELQDPKGSLSSYLSLSFLFIWSQSTLFFLPKYTFLYFTLILCFLLAQVGGRAL